MEFLHFIPEPPRDCGKYTRVNCILTTNNSTVYQGFVVGSRQKVVLKFIPLDGFIPIELIDNECKIQSNITHPFIMPIQTSDLINTKISFRIIEMPQAKFSLASIHTEKIIKKIEQVYKIMYQISLGIQYLHQSRILHGDIKPENIVMMNDNIEKPEIKIIDFGHSVQFQNDEIESCIVQMKHGTWAFNSPEVLLKLPHSFPSDIWSLGATFYFLLTGENIHHTSKVETMINQAKKLRLDFVNSPFNQYPSQRGIDLIQKMVSFDPKLRPTADQIVDDPFFAEVIDNEWLSEQKRRVKAVVSDENSRIQNEISLSNDD